MVNDLVWLIGRINLVLAAAIVLVLLLRAPARRLFGARVAYALWLMPLLAAAMCFAPARIIHVFVSPPTSSATAVVQNNVPWLFFLWVGGALVSLSVLALRQFRFTQSLGRLFPRDDLGSDVLGAESAAQGPAVIGVLRPVIVTPSDFDQRFDEDERRIVLAHERAHLDQGDPWINAAVVVLQCLNWFNPFVHLGARALRVDQELACDAAVLAQADGARRRYAETMLKTQLAAAAPIGCAWPPSSTADLKERIAMLKQALPSRTQRLIGASTIAIATVAACAAAWAAQPARVVATVAPTAPATHAPAPLPPDIITPGDFMPVAQPVHSDEVLAGGDKEWDGPVIVTNERDLTPEQRRQIRAAIAQAREQVAEAMRESGEARAEALAEARAELDAHRGEIAEAMREEREGRAERQRAAIEAQEAVREAQREMAASQAERAQALAEAHAELQAAQARIVEARTIVVRAPEAQAEIRAARAAVAREAAEARRAGDAERIDELRRAQDALDRAEARAHRHDDDDSDSDDDN